MMKKHTAGPCAVLAASGKEEMLRAVLLSLGDVQDLMPAAGPRLVVRTARTLTQVRQGMSPSGAEEPPGILVYAPSGNEPGFLDDLLLISGKNEGLQILLLVPQAMQPRISWRCRKYRVCVCALPLRRQTLTEMLRMMVLWRGALLRQEEEILRLQKKVSDLALISRAKCLLIQHRGLTEEGAHHHLEKQAMDHGLTRRDVAAGILRQYQDA